MQMVKCLLLLSVILFHSPGSRGQDDFLTDQNVCMPDLVANDVSVKDEYRVGVLGIRGEEAAYEEFNKTFSDYLTATAGQRFERPIRFSMVYLNFRSLFSDVELSLATNGAEGVDFIYVNPSAFSCIESEYGANTLVSQVSLRKVEGKSYELTKFGGVIFTRADNDEINVVEDLRNKSVACASISGLGSGQMQFRLMQQRGLAYIQDPKQLVFTSNQGAVVLGVLNGQFDVGFVRTDQIERTLDPISGELIDKTQLKIIEGKTLDLDGEPFPFASSTVLYPEWNLASLPNVANEVAIEVQNAMLAIRDHATIGAAIDSCLQANNCTDTVYSSLCYVACVSEIDPSTINRCDAKASIATLALAASKNGKYAGWQSTLSYMELRNMQEETNFIRKDPITGINQCIRSSEIVDAVVCPPGHFKKPYEQVVSGCADDGLDCGDYECLCKPCVKAFDVDVLPIYEINRVAGTERACGKFSICGIVEQGKSLTFVAVDNKQREDLSMRIVVLEGSNELELKAVKIDGMNYTYEFTIEAWGSATGISILEVYADDEQIPESPLRFEVYERQCAAETGDVLREADEFGQCYCSSGSHDIGGKCVADSVLIPSILIPLLILLAFGIYFYVEQKRKQADSIWAVKPDELIFDDPPTILGRGTFGLVLLAEYRGTQVAVKRVIPPKLSEKRKKVDSQSSYHWRNDLLGDGDTRATFSDVPEGEQDFEIDEKASSFQEKKDDSDDVEKGTAPETALSDISNTGISSENNFRPSVRLARRASLAGNSKMAAGLFDFENAEMTSATKTNLGLESGSIHQVMQQLNGSEMRMPRRHSISSMNSSFSEIAPTKLPSNGNGSTKQLRRGSGGSSGSGRRHSLTGGITHFAPPIYSSAESSCDHSTCRDQSNDGLEKGAESVDAATFKKLVVQEEKPNMLQAAAGHVSGSYGMKSSGTHSFGMGSSDGGRNRKYDIKRITQSVIGKGDEYSRLKTEFIAEMRHISKLRHPCITTVMGAVISKRSEPMLVMEYMDHGSLYDLLHNESMPIDGELVLPILRDVAQGVRFLHAADPIVIHGDLKAQNILVDSKFRAKVADFGLSQKKTVGATGTPLWMAPELLRGEAENSPTTDVYSFGIMLYEVYSRKDPYDGEDVIEVLRGVADLKINKRPPVPKNCPANIATIMTDCLVGEPHNRPSFEELDLRMKRLDVENVEPGQTLFSMQKRKDQRAQRNEDLLFDVFPRHIAEALRDGRKVESESFDCVTIFFSDIVGYTTISSTLSPMKISDMLDRLYLRFDALSVIHDVFKIETIGDAYMAVTNLHREQADHAARTAQFCIDTVNAASETLIDLDDPAKGYVQIRAGFHSGPIVADVVGSRLPKYTLFGDTVNIAARMESNSLPERIQCSERAAELVREQKDDYDIYVIPRGKINVKGKGEMVTFWIDDKPPASKSTSNFDKSIGKKKSLRAIVEGES